MPNSPLSRLLCVSKALANRARLRIVAVLDGNELCVGQVAAIFDIARSTASEHLSGLRRAGLLAERRDGKFVYYALARDEGSRGTLDVVLARLAHDAAVRADREMTARILALPHDLVCEQGRAALAAATGTASPETPQPGCRPSPLPDTGRQRVP